MTRDEVKFNDIEQLSAQIAKRLRGGEGISRSVKDPDVTKTRKKFSGLCYKQLDFLPWGG